MTREDIYNAIDRERMHQSVKWDRPHQWGAGDCSAPLAPTVKAAVLGEEYGEVCRAVHDQNPDSLRAELIQVAAVAVAWLEGME